MTGNPSIDKILLGLNGAFIAAATALIIYAHTGIKRPPINEAGQMRELIDESLLKNELTPVVFPKQVVNLYSRATRLRFLDMQMNVEVFEAAHKDIIELYKPYILDSLIQITGNMQPEELNSVTGRILLETRLKSRINTHLARHVVKKIYFSRFIIQ